MFENFFEVVVHYDEEFVNNGTKYNGKTSTWSCDPDR